MLNLSCLALLLGICLVPVQLLCQSFAVYSFVVMSLGGTALFPDKLFPHKFDLPKRNSPKNLSAQTLFSNEFGYPDHYSLRNLVHLDTIH